MSDLMSPSPSGADAFPILVPGAPDDDAACPSESPALHPTEVRSARAPAPSAPARGGRGRVIATVAGCAVLFAGAAAGSAYWYAGDGEPARPRNSAITMGPLPDMPEIKGGIPAVVARPAPRVISTTASIPDAKPAETAAPAMDLRTAAARPAEPAAPAPAAAPATQLASVSPSSKIAPEKAAVVEKPSIVKASTGAAAVVPPPVTDAAVPLPPARPNLRADEKVATTRVAAPVPPPVARPSVVADAYPPPRQLPSREAPPPPAPAQPQRADVLGVPVPDFVPQTGRRIRDAAGAVADAVTSIPDLF